MTARDLISPDEMMRLDDKKQMLLSAGQRPILCNKVFYYKDNRFTERLLSEASGIPKLDVAKFMTRTSPQLSDIDLT